MDQATRLALAGVTVAVLSLLDGCARLRCLAEQCYSGPDGVITTADGTPVTEEGRAKRAALAELRARAAEDNRKEAERRAEEWRAYQARLEAMRAEQEAAQKEGEDKRKARIAAVEARGYKLVSFRDLYRDLKKMPIGSKRAVVGWYRIDGRLETLSAGVYEKMAAAPLRQGLNDGIDLSYASVFLLTDKTPRALREKLRAPPCPALCEAFFLGHTTYCTLTDSFTIGGRTGVCFAVDGELQ